MPLQNFLLRMISSQYQWINGLDFLLCKKPSPQDKTRGEGSFELLLSTGDEVKVNRQSAQSRPFT